MAFKDYRNKAQRTALEMVVPQWVVSKEMTYLDANMNANFVLFSLPVAPLVGRTIYFVHEIYLDVVAVFDDTPTLTLGEGTIPTDDTVESGVLTVVDADEYINNTTAALTVLGRKYPANAENWITVPNRIKPGADAAVPIIYADIGTAGNVATVGSMFIYALISTVPYK